MTQEFCSLALLGINAQARLITSEPVSTSVNQPVDVQINPPMKVTDSPWIFAILEEDEYYCYGFKYNQITGDIVYDKIYKYTFVKPVFDILCEGVM